MAETMRELMIEAMNAEIHIDVFGDIINWPAVLDVALAILRKPDDAMHNAYTEAADDIDGPAAMYLQDAAFAAMIDVVMSGK